MDSSFLERGQRDLDCPREPSNAGPRNVVVGLLLLSNVLLGAMWLSEKSGHDVGLPGPADEVPETRRRLADASTTEYLVAANSEYTNVLQAGWKLIRADADSTTTEIMKIKNGRAMCNDVARLWAQGALNTQGVWNLDQPVGPQQCGQIWNADSKSWEDSTDLLHENVLTGDCACNLELSDFEYVGGEIPNERDDFTFAEALDRCMELGPEETGIVVPQDSVCYGVYCTDENTASCALRNKYGRHVTNPMPTGHKFYTLDCRKRSSESNGNGNGLPVHWECRYENGPNPVKETYIGHTTGLWGHVDPEVANDVWNAPNTPEISDPHCECLYDEDLVWGHGVGRTNVYYREN